MVNPHDPHHGSGPHGLGPARDVPAPAGLIRVVDGVEFCAVVQQNFS